VILAATQADDPLAQRSKGRPDAPVTVYEMADFQCPACRLFAVTVLPTLEREYIETGKVRWVFINLPLTSIHPNAAAAAEVAMCAGRQGRFWPTHDALYQQQDDWAKLAQPRATLIALAQRAGTDKAKLLACLNAGSARQEVELDAQRAARSGAQRTGGCASRFDRRAVAGSDALTVTRCDLLRARFAGRDRRHGRDDQQLDGGQHH